MYVALSYKQKWEEQVNISGGNANYFSFLCKTRIRRTRKPLAFTKEIMEWLDDNLRPSSNSSNIVKWKDQNNNKCSEVIHWRDVSLQSLFDKCKLEIKNGALLKKTYFIGLIPPYVKKATLQEGLCPIHMRGRNFGNELEAKRKAWHFPSERICICTCIFCSSIGCNHGKNPDRSIDPNASCNLNNCNRCKYNKCPVDWKSDFSTSWYITSLELRKGGGQQWIDTKFTGSREDLMKQWKEEMDAFNAHHTKAEKIKKLVNWLKKNLPLKSILIKGDFIQNIVHKRGRESSTAYYNKRQTQLLTFVIWYHDKDSTAAKPNIKRLNVNYLSGYLKHTSLFFQKCFAHLIRYLKDILPCVFDKVCRFSLQFYINIYFFVIIGVA